MPINFKPLPLLSLSSKLAIRSALIKTAWEGGAAVVSFTWGDPAIPEAGKVGL